MANRKVPDGTINEEIRQLLVDLGWAEDSAREMAKQWWSKRAIEEMKIGVIRKKRRAERRTEVDNLMKRRKKGNGADEAS